MQKLVITLLLILGMISSTNGQKITGKLIEDRLNNCAVNAYQQRHNVAAEPKKAFDTTMVGTQFENLLLSFGSNIRTKPSLQILYQGGNYDLAGSVRSLTEGNRTSFQVEDPIYLLENLLEDGYAANKVYNNIGKTSQEHNYDELADAFKCAFSTDTLRLPLDSDLLILNEALLSTQGQLDSAAIAKIPAGVLYAYESHAVGTNGKIKASAGWAFLVVVEESYMQSRVRWEIKDSLRIIDSLHVIDSLNIIDSTRYDTITTYVDSLVDNRWHVRISGIGSYQESMIETGPENATLTDDALFVFGGGLRGVFNIRKDVESVKITLGGDYALGSTNYQYDFPAFELPNGRLTETRGRTIVEKEYSEVLGYLGLAGRRGWFSLEVGYGRYWLTKGLTETIVITDGGEELDRNDKLTFNDEGNVFGAGIDFLLFNFVDLGLNVTYRDFSRFPEPQTTGYGSSLSYGVRVGIQF